MVLTNSSVRNIQCFFLYKQQQNLSCKKGIFENSSEVKLEKASHCINNLLMVLFSNDQSTRIICKTHQVRFKFKKYLAYFLVTVSFNLFFFLLLL